MRLIPSKSQQINMGLAHKWNIRLHCFLLFQKFPLNPKVLIVIPIVPKVPIVVPTAPEVTIVVPIVSKVHIVPNY
ncbi:hypothetical protein CEXT_246981 [Caerostris extrusa]|uniref:Uncharacterized protein n=1 Tax=Caerostris extrusa TaxID=172846 RepID=A0AAV4VCT9_CAEEX|nr:hypothetical protein CEXT_246981 [Caerostris extrusa]